MKKQAALSVASEVDELTCALEAARLIAEYLQTEQLATDADAQKAPRLVIAILNIVTERMRLLTRIARGGVDPGKLIAHHNEAIEGEEGIVLKSWCRNGPHDHSPEQ